MYIAYVFIKNVETGQAAHLLVKGDDANKTAEDFGFQVVMEFGEDRDLPAPPMRGSNPVTAGLYNGAPDHRQGGSGPPAATMERPVASADALTIFDQDGPKCATHKVGKPSKRRGEFFCPVRVGEGYCEWVYPPAARR